MHRAIRFGWRGVTVAAVLSLSAPNVTAQVFGTGDPYAGTVDEAATITLDVIDRPLADVLNLIRDRSGANILLAPGVEATVTVAFSGVPWREALDIVAERAECVVIESRGRVFKVTKPPRVTFGFEDEDIRKVIQSIAKAAGANIIISPEVRGLVTMEIQNRPWRDALDNVVKTLGFKVVEEERGVLRIVTPAALEEQLETAVIELKYLRPQSTYVAQIKTDFAVGEPKAPTNDPNTDFPLLVALRKQLSKNGELDYFDKQNAVFIKDIKPVIDNVREIIERLDVEPSQIFIDVKFVTTQTGDDLDVAFGLDNGIVATMNMAAIPTRTPFNTGADGFGEEVFPLDEGISNENFDDTIVRTGLLDFRAVRLAVRLTETDNRVEVIQAPKLITLDHQEATVFVGDIIRYAETSSATNQAGGLAFSIREAENSPVETGFQLLVIPHVVPSTNKILMTVIPQARFLSGTTDPNLDGFNLFGDEDVATISLPQITSQTVVTNMMLESGQTGVIGGLITDRKAKIVTKVPVLGDIPFLGFFFRRTQENENHNNLLVLLTPVIVRGSDQSREALAQVLADAKTKSVEEWESMTSGGGMGDDGSGDTDGAMEDSSGE